MNLGLIHLTIIENGLIRERFLDMMILVLISMVLIILLELILMKKDMIEEVYGIDVKQMVVMFVLILGLMMKDGLEVMLIRVLIE